MIFTDLLIIKFNEVQSIKVVRRWSNDLRLQDDFFYLFLRGRYIFTVTSAEYNSLLDYLKTVLIWLKKK